MSTMEHSRGYLLNRAIRVLNSCTHKDQLLAARRFYELTVRAMRLEEADAYRTLKALDDYYWNRYRACDR